MLKTITYAWRDFVSLFFPPLCLSCDEPLPYTEPFLCFDCQLSLPQTDFHLHKKNPFTERFEGRIGLESAAALFYFTKMSKTRHLIHKIKYEDKQEAAIELGRLMGLKLKESLHFQGITAIVPVPMHFRKELLRGYNQAEIFATGLSQTMQIPVNNRILKKTQATQSQTLKDQWQRIENTKNVFEVTIPSVLKGQHLLIVDDVFTTGATLEACASAILEKNEDVKLSFATIAFVKY